VTGAQRKWERKSVKVPLPAVTAIESNDALYTSSNGCQQGIHLAKVGERSFFLQATPPAQDRSFLVSVNGKALDSFGTGLNAEYAADRVFFSDLFFMVPDLTTDVEFETCFEGKTQQHTVSMNWKPEYDKGIRYVTEPTVEGVSSQYELFGDVAVMAMTVNHVDAILTTVGDPAPARWMHPDFVAQPRLIVNYVRSGSYASHVIPVGSAVTKVNGQEVRSLEEFGQAFVPKQGKVWTIETDTGKVVAMIFNKSLGDQIQQAEFQRAPHLLTPSVVGAAEKLGFKIGAGAGGVQDAAHKETAAIAVKQQHGKASTKAPVAAGPVIASRSGRSVVTGKFTTRGADVAGVKFSSEL